MDNTNKLEALKMYLNAQEEFLTAVRTFNQHALNSLEVSITPLSTCQSLQGELGQRINARVSEIISQEFDEELKIHATAIQEEINQLLIPIMLKVSVEPKVSINSVEAQKVFNAALKYAEVTAKSGSDFINFFVDKALNENCDQDNTIDLSQNDDLMM